MWLQTICYKFASVLALYWIRRYHPAFREWIPYLVQGDSHCYVQQKVWFVYDLKWVWYIFVSIWWRLLAYLSRELSPKLAPTSSVLCLINRNTRNRCISGITIHWFCEERVLSCITRITVTLSAEAAKHGQFSVLLQYNESSGHRYYFSNISQHSQSILACVGFEHSNTSYFQFSESFLG